MKLPTWIPQTPRPFNIEWRDTWQHMTPNERRWSFLVDAAILGFGIVVIGFVFR